MEEVNAARHGAERRSTGTTKGEPRERGSVKVKNIMSLAEGRKAQNFSSSLKKSRIFEIKRPKLDIWNPQLNKKAV